MAKRPEFKREFDFRIPEIFGDAFESMIASDGCIYLTFSARRSEGTRTGGPPEIRQVTSGRVVLTVPAAGVLMDQLTKTFGLMAADGIVRREREEPKTVQ